MVIFKSCVCTIISADFCFTLSLFSVFNSATFDYAGLIYRSN